jgi:O-antigen/teichoic acid export membrane protein
MSRSRRFVANSAAGYAFLAANFVYTAVSIPLALSYLGKEQFGLWALAMQITGYFVLLDLGVTSAVSRFLADSKDDPSGSEYGSVFAAGVLVLLVQGLLIAIAGCAFSLVAPILFAIPADLGPTFRNLLVAMSCLTGFSVAVRSIGTPLWAFQRLDVTYVLGIATLALGLTALWLGFELGWGVYSLALSGIPAALICPFLTFVVCHRMGYYPSWHACQLLGLPLFKRIFLFGKDILLMTLGSQIVSASQVMILSRAAGLEAAAVFAVATKMFTMGQQFTGRIIESSAPSLTEIFIRNDRLLFRDRFRDILLITMLLSTVFGGLLVTSNSTVISIWTSGIIQWNHYNDLLLGLLLVLTATTRCILGLFGIAAMLRPVRSVYFIEACVFLVLAIPAAFSFGTTGLLVACIFTHLATTTAISVRAARGLLGSNSPSISLVFRAAVVLIALSLASQVVMQPVSLMSVILHAGATVLVVAVAGWLVIVPAPSRVHLLARARSILFRAGS